MHDLALVMRALWVPKLFARDPTIPPLPFDLSEYHSERPLRVGYFDEIGYFGTAGACRRAVKEAVQALRESGL